MSDHKHGFSCIDKAGRLICGQDGASPAELMRTQLASLEARQYKTHGDEVSIKLLKQRLAVDPSRFQVGMGVSYRVAAGRRSQTNRGFRIMALDTEGMRALLGQVADTGLTSSGGNFDRMGQEWRSLGDLKRDKKYDGAVLRKAPAPVKAPPVPRAPTPFRQRAVLSHAPVAHAPRTPPAPARSASAGEFTGDAGALLRASARGGLGLHVQQYPSGKWGFVGTVPMELSYRMPDGSRVPDEIAKSIRDFGPGLYTRGPAPRVKSVVFESREEAITEATRLGCAIYRFKE